LIFITVGCSTTESQQQASAQMETLIDFWNGNRSEAGQTYERGVDWRWDDIVRKVGLNRRLRALSRTMAIRPVEN
jgi:hypothetical protein